MESLEQAVQTLIENNTQLLLTIQSFAQAIGTGTVVDGPKLNEVVAKIQTVSSQLDTANNELKNVVNQIAPPPPPPEGQPAA